MIFGVSVSEKMPVARKSRFADFFFWDKLWRKNARLNLIRPDPVLENRLAAPRWVFIFGISTPVRRVGG